MFVTNIYVIIINIIPNYNLLKISSSLAQHLKIYCIINITNAIFNNSYFLRFNIIIKTTYQVTWEKVFKICLYMKTIYTMNDNCCNDLLQLCFPLN